jgi:hypothetical protein
MGKSNPLRPISDVLEGTVRAVKDNPEKLFLTSTYTGYEGVKQLGKEAQQSAARQVAGAQKDAAASVAQANADKLIAEESVRAQKERARKKTVFGGSTDSNLFNKSLIGSSTTAAAGTQRSILGA